MCNCNYILIYIYLKTSKLSSFYFSNFFNTFFILEYFNFLRHNKFHFEKSEISEHILVYNVFITTLLTKIYTLEET